MSDFDLLMRLECSQEVSRLGDPSYRTRGFVMTAPVFYEP